jgi:AcrR family transcriptional regulator
MGKAVRTKRTILDAAEVLFAEHGFDVVSMREVSDRAGVPLGLINYHFGTKEKLFEAAIARRADELNARRREALASIGKAPTIEAILVAFLRPYLELTLQGGPGWRSYGRLVAQTGQSHRWSTLITGHFGEVAKLFIAALTKAEPGLTREKATRGYVHMVAAMMGIFAANDLLDIISEGRHSSRDIERACGWAIPFLVGGFQGMAAYGSAVGMRTASAKTVPRPPRAKLAVRVRTQNGARTPTNNKRKRVTPVSPRV